MHDADALVKLVDLCKSQDIIDKDLNEMAAGKFRFRYTWPGNDFHFERAARGSNCFLAFHDLQDATLQTLATVLTRHLPEIREWMYHELLGSMDEALLAAADDINLLKRNLEEAEREHSLAPADRTDIQTKKGSFIATVDDKGTPIPSLGGRK